MFATKKLKDTSTIFHGIAACVMLTQDIALTLQAEGASATVRLQVHRPLGAFAEFCPVSVLRNIHGLACWFSDSRLALQESFFAVVKGGDSKHDHWLHYV